MSRFTRYYSGSDVTVYITGVKSVMIDKVYGVGILEKLDSQPIYNIGESEFAFINKGNTIAIVSLDVNFIHDELVSKAIDYAAGGNNSRKITKPTLTDALSMSVAQLKAVSLGESYTSGAKLLAIPDNFEIIIAFNAASALQPDSSPSTIRLSSCKIIEQQFGVEAEQDGQIIKRYSIYGKYE